MPLNLSKVKPTEMVREPAAFRARTSSSGLSAWALYSDIFPPMKNYSHGGLITSVVYGIMSAVKPKPKGDAE